MDLCHCGKPIHIYPDGFTRGLCEECSTVRCDLPLEEGRHHCYSSNFETQVDNNGDIHYLGGTLEAGVDF